MPRAADPDAALLELGALIEKEPRTAKYLAQAMKVSKPTAYARLDALRELARTAGLKIVTVRIREGKTGPKSKAYQLVDADDQKAA